MSTRLENALINLSISLSDIKNSGYVKKASNGKYYLSLTLRQKDKKDEYGNDIYAFCTQTKEEREKPVAERPELKFVGNGRLIEFTENVEEMAEASSKEIESDLTF